ncbi:MAG: hypothetical protein AB1467_02115 [Candidatus Diapherotrites archaeon]
MAWTTVETPNAKYVLIFSYHSMISEIPIIEYDALVLESGGLASVKKIVKSRQYKKLINQATQNQKQIWLTDAEPAFLSLLELVGQRIIKLPVTSLELPFILSKIHKKEIKHSKYWGITTKIQLFPGVKGVATIRNAISAEKCESFFSTITSKRIE